MIRTLPTIARVARGVFRRSPLAAFSLLSLAAAAALASPGFAYNVYYANLHSHTALSDGIGTPAEAYAYARDVADIDVLAITDHTHYLTSAEWTQLRNAATAATAPGVFVALASQEFGILNDFGHINIDDCAFLNPGSTENLLATYAFIQQVNAVGAFNHPNPDYGTAFNNLEFYPEYESAMRMIEMRNGFYSGDYEDRFNLALGNGWKLAPVANQDNHDGHWGDQLNHAGRILLTGILADSLTHDQITDAIHARRVFAMEVFPASDRMELEFQVDGQQMGSEIIVGIAPHFTVHARSVNGINLFYRVELYRDGILRNSKSVLGTEIFYDYYEAMTEGEEHYYYAIAYQLDGDKAWSAPIWTHAQIDPAGVSPVAASATGALRAVPDPFTSSTAVRLVLDGAATLTGSDRPPRLHIVSPSGRIVRDLNADAGSAGPGWLWDGRDEAGRAVPPGIYFLRAEGLGGARASGRVVRIR